MAILIGVQKITKAFGHRPLFRDLSFTLESGDRVGLIGPNGTGKSTLLRILAGRDTPDTGQVSMQRGISIGYLEQIPSFRPGATVHEAVLESVEGDWERSAQASEMLSRLELLDPAKPVSELSGGWQKRVALARELAKKPDLLLLDEPTNHLDLESILWLEETLARAPFATLTITHDRAFLQNVANRILEINPRYPDGILSVKGDYATFLETKNTLLEQQESRQESLSNVLRRETEWLRRGAKARTTKQQARIKRAEDLKAEVLELETRNIARFAQLDFQAAAQAPKKLLEAEKIAGGYGDRMLFRDFSMIFTPKTRVGLLGPNGCGKSTLIRTLLGETEPRSGRVFRSDQLQPLYFEQTREALDPELTVTRTLCPTGDHVHYRGERLHIRSYLSRYLFAHDQSEMKVGKLSGGEQSRLLLARLMLRESNFLVLDEPTNDLDLPTLDLLQASLRDFPGAVVLVTHDRYFMDQVVDRILGFDARTGLIVPFASLEQWKAWHDLMQDELAAEREPPAGRAAAALPGGAATASVTPSKPVKLSYKDQYELDRMEETIHQAEADLARWTEAAGDPTHSKNAAKLAEISREMAAAQANVDRLYTRWEELEAKLSKTRE